MFNGILRATGLTEITVKLENKKIIINGLTYNEKRELLKATMFTWKTSKIAKHLFQLKSFNELRIDEFFIFELYYILKNIQFPKFSLDYGHQLANKLLVLLEQNTWIKDAIVNQDTLKYNAKALNVLNGNPLPHNEIFFNKYLNTVKNFRLNGYVLGSEPGTGKTYMNIALGVILGVDSHICVSPKNAVHLVWEEEINKWHKKPKKIWFSDRNDDIDDIYDYYVLSYEAIGKFLTLVNSNKSKFKNTMITLDESHNFNELTAQRTLDFINLCEVTKSENIVWSSGTPIKAMGKEVIPMMRTIDPLFTPKVEEVFKGIYGGSRTEALKILSERIGYILFKVDKKTVVDNQKEEEIIKVIMPDSDKYTLPEVKKVMLEFIKERTDYYKTKLDYYTKRYFEILDIYKNKIQRDKKELAELTKYNNFVKIIKKTSLMKLRDIKEEVKFCNLYEKKIIKSLDNEDGKEFKELKTIYKYLPLKIRGEALGRVIAKLRSDCASEMVPYIGLENYIKISEKKSVIFTDYVETVDVTYGYLTSKGFKPLIVYGKTNNDLSNIVESFAKVEDYNPLIATFKSLSTAVPLTMANTVIFLNAPFRSYILNQAISRVDRKGQDSIVRQYTCILDTGDVPNINSRNLDIMKWYEEQVNDMLGIEYDETLDDETSISLEQLELFNTPVDKAQTISNYIIYLNKTLDDLKVNNDLIKQIVTNKVDVNINNVVKDIIENTGNTFNSVISSLDGFNSKFNREVINIYKTYSEFLMSEELKPFLSSLSDLTHNNPLPFNYIVLKENTVGFNYVFRTGEQSIKEDLFNNQFVDNDTTYNTLMLLTSINKQLIETILFIKDHYENLKTLQLIGGVDLEYNFYKYNYIPLEEFTYNYLTIVNDLQRLIISDFEGFIDV